MKNTHLILAIILFVIVGYYTSSSTIEAVSAISGLFCVALAAKENIWNYPIGFVNIAAFMYIFYDAKLYADFTLQIVFLILGVFGWVYWLKNKGDKTVRETTLLTKKGYIISTITVILVPIIWAYLLKTYTDASIPYLDSLIATLSILAQVLLSKKVLQNWYVWIVVDILSVAMYMHKDLHMIALLYVVFLFNAVMGAVLWHKNFKENRRDAVNI